MDTKQKLKELSREDKINFVVTRLKDMAMLYERYSNARFSARAIDNVLRELHIAENELYDLIGGMEGYKYDE